MVTTLHSKLLKSCAPREVLIHCHCHNFLLYSEETRTWTTPHFSEFFRTRFFNMLKSVAREDSNSDNSSWFLLVHTEQNKTQMDCTTSVSSSTPRSL
ncbi:uncharacterized protein LOC118424830 isoform X2 [Branchiostoma floridae]|uniref:Uncharacterized protein LOC118424830 isoform X2 n=1 Tax=Branchiostoma floridae TaxID=7739 RepID=A0A9J7LVX5_BRAFL|nr:uncharacterized protein LOC118424830 isoform X2 [Branchiostoma floridae]